MGAVLFVVLSSLVLFRLLRRRDGVVSFVAVPLLFVMELLFVFIGEAIRMFPFFVVWLFFN